MNTTPEQRRELREKAEALSITPWEIERNIEVGNIYIRESRGNKGRICRIWNERTLTDENAEFIAAASPATILKLLDDIEALERERDAMIDASSYNRDVEQQFYAACGVPDCDTHPGKKCAPHAMNWIIKKLEGLRTEKPPI